MQVHYSSLSELSVIIENISSPQTNVAILSDPGTVSIRIHSDRQRNNISYFASKSKIDSLKKKPALGGVFLQPNQVTEGDVSLEDTPFRRPSHILPKRSIFPNAKLGKTEDTTCPVKCVTQKLDDSGFIGDDSQASCSTDSNIFV